MFLPLHRLVSPSRHYLSLTLLFLCWKSLLLFIVLLAPGPGYDTSTTLLRWIGGNGWAGSLDQTSQTPNSIFARALNHLATRVVRWDAIYFTQIAQRGYVYEQEWAFGWGFTRTLSWLARTLFRTENLAVGEIALAGVVLAHLCHWGSVLLLYELTSAVFGGNGKGEVVKENTREEGKPEVLAFMSACLHIISPAGVFLSAPYAEAPFSLLNFGGCYTYILAVQAYLQRRDGVAHGLMVMVGVLFGVASIFRGNGLFSGLLLVYEAVKALRNIYMLRCEERSFLTDLTRLIVVGLTGILMACIAIWPQYLAYREYCLDLKPGTERPWCRSKIPSIYAWVQQDNWGVGFLRYWTLSNLPLFLLAAPTLTAMALSCRWIWNVAGKNVLGLSSQQKENPQPSTLHGQGIQDTLLPLALPQLMLAFLALTVYHVQIITRLSSGYVIWYWWLASKLVKRSRSQGPGGNWNAPKAMVYWMVSYTLIQASLFASFLPPA